MVHRNPYQHVFPAFIFTRSCSLQPFPLVLWLPYGRKKRAVSVAAIDAIWGDGRPDHVYSINYQYQLRHRSLSPARNLPKTLVPLHVRPGEAYHLLPSRGFGMIDVGNTPPAHRRPAPAHQHPMVTPTRGGEPSFFVPFPALWQPRRCTQRALLIPRDCERFGLFWQSWATVCRVECKGADGRDGSM